MNDLFRRIAHRASVMVGSPTVFVLAVAIVILWSVTGSYFHYSDTWQLIINTGTSVLTFLMVFLIQNTQNRDGRALQLKLDELIRAGKTSRNQLLDLEDLSDMEMELLHQQFQQIRDRANKVKKITS